MKKQLLALAVAVGGVFGANAETLYTMTFGADYNQAGTSGYTDVSFEVKDAEGNTWLTNNFNNNKNGWDYAKCIAKNTTNGTATISTTFAVDGILDEIVINGKLAVASTTGTIDVYASEDDTFSAETKVGGIDVKTLTSKQGDVAIPLSNAASDMYYKVKFTCSNSTKTNGAVWVYSVKYNGSKGAPAAVAAPEFGELTEGQWGAYNLALTCSTEGAEIYYTLDGSEPSKDAIKYTSPIELYSGTTTVKAIAYKGEEASKVAVKVVDVPYVLDSFSALAGMDEEMMAGVGGEIKFIVNGNMTYVYQNGAYLYLTDGSYYVMCYGKDKGTFKPGDTFSTLSGTYNYFNGQPQVKNYTIGEATPGQRIIKPMEIDGADEIASYMINRYMTISGVSIGEIDGRNATMTDAAGSTVALYNQFNIDGFVAGKNLTVTGIVGLYKAKGAESATVQFLPTEIVNEAGEEMVAAPVFSLESGEYTENTEITITSATEGATIVYTINGGDILEYSAPIVLTEYMTIEAYATKDGMTDSEVVEATYTVKPAEPVDENKATFDFSKNGFGKITCNPAITTYPDGNATDINDVEMTVNGVSLTFAKVGNNNNALYASDNTLRIYTSNTLTVSVSDLYTITKIAFSKGTSWAMTFPEGQQGEFVDGIWTAPAAVAREEVRINDVTFSASAKTFIKAIDVEFAKVSTGVEEVEVEESAEAVYYTLQGVRVENPAGGLYIRVAGKTASKVYIR